MSLDKMKVSQKDQERLQKAGNHIDFGEIPNRDLTLRDVARICDLAPAWVRTQLKTGKIAGFKKKQGNRAIWAVKPEECARIRAEQVEKLLNRLDNVGKDKKWSYKRPTQWAYDLTVKAIKADKKLDSNQKKEMLAAMKRYEGQWERAYQERLAKREANKAEKDKK